MVWIGYSLSYTLMPHARAESLPRRCQGPDGLGQSSPYLKVCQVAQCLDAHRIITVKTSVHDFNRPCPISGIHHTGEDCQRLYSPTYCGVPGKSGEKKMHRERNRKLTL